MKRPRGLQIALMILLASTVAGCHERQNDQASPRRFVDDADYCAGNRPQNSRGPVPRGTPEDPFVGYAVVLAINPHSEALVRVVIKQRPIPHFDRAGKLSFYLRPALLDGVDEGDFVRMQFVRLSETSDLSRRYAAAAARKERIALPYVYCGHELVKLEVVPDDQFPDAEK
jgi:hypothetical protein